MTVGFPGSVDILSTFVRIYARICFDFKKTVGHAPQSLPILDPGSLPDNRDSKRGFLLPPCIETLVAAATSVAPTITHLFQPVTAELLLLVNKHRFTSC